ncbi:MAG TPA: MFS transporter [Actinophytocola sp.]|uniref:MFS transporter n=1 Tax=Actinophytocola sp. TaxID=1872138 RepID=UPI002DDD73B0|nr:MFS transporter [Actinophytocola sp.]HEV2780263.1 MFS transporter [Actinophytocola sp.]
MSAVDNSPGMAKSKADRRREQNGWVWYDWANSVFPTSVVTVFGSLYLTAVAAEGARVDVGRNGPNACPADAEGNRDKLHDCDISVLGFDFPAGSLWGYLLALATVIQVLIVPLMGAIADRTRHKKRMLAIFAFGGASATALMALVTGGNWGLGVVLFVLANIGYGTSIAIYYSFIPEIATADERDGLSARGWAFGYLGSGTALLIQLVLVLGGDSIGISEGDAARLAFLISGLWWAGFTLIPLRRLRDQQRPHGEEQGAFVLSGGFRELRDTLRAARAFPLTLAFLGTYLIYTDGIATVANVSAQYGREELKFDQDVLITTILIVQFIAFIGGMLHGVVARRLGAKTTIMLSLTVWVLVVGAAYFVQAGQQLQFYGLAVGIGLVLGGTNALSRSLFSHLIPPGKEAQYYSVYEVGERATSWLGPLLFAAMAQITGSFRPAIISLVIFFLAGLVLLYFVPVRRAIQAAGNPEPSVL